MRLAQMGDKKAYELALFEMMPIIRNFLKKFSYSTKVDIDELTQETLLAIHQASQTYNSDRAIKPWILAIASYKLKDHLRILYRKNKFSEIDFAEVENSLFEEPLQEQQEQVSLAEILKTLPSKQQKILHSLKIKGNSLQETANELNMSVAAVKVAAHRAYKILIEKYSQQK